ncbi:MAG: purine-nucleoside phosphorylase [Bacteroidota bacterium]
MTHYDRIQETTSFLRARTDIVPQCAIVLGTGLGNLTSEIDIHDQIPYSDIPHFPPATVKGHKGSLVFGTLAGTQVVAQSGRYHYYEGYDMKQVTFPIYVFKYLQASTLIIASATGGIHEDYFAGDITVVNDHINLHDDNPLRGPNDPRLGPRFPDMSEAYSSDLIGKCHDIATSSGIKLHDSIYGGLPGPNLETKAEYQMLHTLGATVVGMSTVPEVIVANHADLPVCVLTVVTNKCWPLSSIGETTHDGVIDVAATAEKKITTIVKELLPRL